MRKRSWIALVPAALAVFSLLVGCTDQTGTGTLQPTTEPTPGPTTAPPSPAATEAPTLQPAQDTAAVGGWWNDTVFYELFVRSFADSDGDGIGDFRGAIERLDYLNDGDPTTSGDLGITGIWLMPMMASPSYHGYDVTDYYAVEPDYGSMEDFRAFVDAAHARGIRVVIDLVLNHSSSAHPWFINASSGPDSEYRDWYVWEEENPGWIGPWGQQVWYKRGDAWYYAVFWDQMPDLNYETEVVTEEIYDVARFWLEEADVDGFRLDAARYLIEDGEQQASTPETRAWWNAFNQYTESVEPGALTVGEVWSDTAEPAGYVQDGDLDLCFEFSLADSILSSVMVNTTTDFSSRLNRVLDAYPPNQFATFLTNHDQNRVMTQLGGNEDKARLAASVLLTLPGVPFIYYGEEIGMTGQKPDELIRTPMQWSAAAGAGFTTGRPWGPINEDYETVNVENQSADPDSLLSHYRQLVHLRNAHPALRRGELLPLQSSCRPVYAFLRHYAGAEGEEAENVLVVLSFAAQEQSGCTFSLPESPLPEGSLTPAELLSGAAVAPLGVGAGGAIEAYAPLETIQPRQGYVLLLAP